MHESETLYDAAEIREMVRRLAGEIGVRYAWNFDDVVFVWLKEGAKMFVEDLLSELGVSPKCVGVRASSYGFSRESCGCVEVGDEISSIGAERVLLIDDVLDSGNTAKCVVEKLKAFGAAEVKTCFLLRKKGKPCAFQNPDFIGFDVPDVFIYGYGMDLDGGLRELPEIRALKQ